LSFSIKYKCIDYSDENDLVQVKYLYKKIFKVLDENKIMYWLSENHAGKPIGILAIDETINKCVGHFGTMAIQSIIGGEKVQGRNSMGFMVDGEYRGNRIATTISDLLFQNVFKDEACKYVIGFPNDVSYKMHLEHMGYRSVRDYNFVEINSNDKHKNIYTQKNVVDLTEHNVEIEHNTLNHDDDYLKWRYRDPKYLIYESDKRNLFITTEFNNKADILYWSTTVTEEELIDFACFIKKEISAERVCTWNTYKWMDDYPKEGRKYHFCINMNIYDDKYSDDIMKPWLFYMGDCELF